MKVLYSWLKEYVDIDVTPKELEEKLFSVGFEVEGVEYLGENLENVVVGQITAMEHYEGTHLQICHVDCGPKGNDHLILTGADNVFVGAKVPAALVGAKLPCGLDIQPRKMVDMISYGMLCSGEEMELNAQWYPGADVNGIMILAEDATIIDTILNGLSMVLSGLPTLIAAYIMYPIQMFINFFVNSGSGQAALTIPILAPLGDLLGISRQLTVLIFQLGDGFSNALFPTSGVLLACLGLAGVPYSKWLKWVLPLQGILFTIALLAITGAYVIGWN